MERYNSQNELPETSVWCFEKQIDDLNEAELYELISKGSQFGEQLGYTASEVVGLFHDAEPRANGEPYYKHPLRVATRILVEFGVDNRVVLAAALHHDTIEDRSIQYSGDRNKTEALSQMDTVNHEVAQVVSGLTNPEYPIEINQSEKDELYLEHVIEHCDKDERVLIVKLSDFIDNAGKLDMLEDENRRKKLINKYSPLVRYFQERLGDDDVTLLSEDKKTELISYLGYIGNLLGK